MSVSTTASTSAEVFNISSDESIRRQLVTTIGGPLKLFSLHPVLNGRPLQTIYDLVQTLVSAAAQDGFNNNLVANASLIHPNCFLPKEVGLNFHLHAINYPTLSEPQGYEKSGTSRIELLETHILFLPEIRELFISIAEMLAADHHDDLNKLMGKMKEDGIRNEVIRERHLALDELFKYYVNNKDSKFIKIQREDLHPHLEKLAAALKEIISFKPTQETVDKLASLPTRPPQALIALLNSKPISIVFTPSPSEQWQMVKNILEAITNSNPDSVGLHLTFESKKVWIQLPPIRETLNNWRSALVERLIELRKIPNTVRFVFEENIPLFDSKSHDVTVALESEKITSSDIKTAIIWLEKVLNYIEKTVGNFKPREVTPEATALETHEGGETPVTENKINPDELKKIALDYVVGAEEYASQAGWINNILFPQFFTLHDISDTEVVDLMNKYPAEFAELKRLFALEIEHVLRTLTPAELAALQSAGGRLAIIRRLYFRLATNPQLIGGLKFIYDAKGLVEKQKLLNKAELLESNLALQDAKIKDVLETASNSLKSHTDLRHASRGDVDQFLIAFGISDSAKREKLFLTIDLILAQRVSPQAITGLNRDLFLHLFEIDMSDVTKTPDDQFSLLLSILTTYAKERRHALMMLYGSKRESDDPNLQAASTIGAELYTTLDIRLISEIVTARNQIYQKSAHLSADGQQSANRVSTKAAIVASSYNREDLDDLEASAAGDEEAVAFSIAVNQAHEFQLEILRQQAIGLILQDLQGIALSQIEEQMLIAQILGAAGEAVGNISPDSHQIGTHLPQQDRRQRMFSPFSNLPRAFNPKSIVQDKIKARAKKALQNFASSASKQALKWATKSVEHPAKLIGGSLAATALSFLFSTSAGIGGVLGGLAGLALSAGLGMPLLAPLFMAIGTGTGIALGGLWDLISANTGMSLPGLGSGLGSSAGGTAAKLGAADGMGGAATTYAAKASTLAGQLFTPAMAAPIGFGLAAATSLTMATKSNNFLMPPVATTGHDGSISQYVTVLKTAFPTKIDNSQLSSQLSLNPEVTYTIEIRPKDEHNITINDQQGIQDIFSFSGNLDKRGDQADPSMPDENHLKNGEALTDSSGVEVVFPLTLSSGSALILQYKIKLDQSYTDSSLANDLTLTFETGADAEKRTETANTRATVCIGDCPNAEGLWPVCGSISQEPFDSRYSHTHVDAFDIAGNAGYKVYAPFNGIALAYREGNECGPYSASGFKSVYGNCVLLQSGGRDFIFGHLLDFDASLIQGKPVKVGDLLGTVGSTGRSSGPHLHYEVRENHSTVQPSLLRDLVPDGATAVYGANITKCFNPTGQ